MNRHDLDLIEIGEKAGAEKERKAVVAFLRAWWDGINDEDVKAVASEIEAGEHLK